MKPTALLGACALLIVADAALAQSAPTTPPAAGAADQPACPMAGDGTGHGMMGPGMMGPGMMGGAAGGPGMANWQQMHDRMQAQMQAMHSQMAAMHSEMQAIHQEMVKMRQAMPKRQ